MVVPTFWRPSSRCGLVRPGTARMMFQIAEALSARTAMSLRILCRTSRDYLAETARQFAHAGNLGSAEHYARLTSTIGEQLTVAGAYNLDRKQTNPRCAFCRDALSGNTAIAGNSSPRRGYVDGEAGQRMMTEMQSPMQDLLVIGDIFGFPGAGDRLILMDVRTVSFALPTSVGAPDLSVRAARPSVQGPRPGACASQAI